MDQHTKGADMIHQFLLTPVAPPLLPLPGRLVSLASKRPRISDKKFNQKTQTHWMIDKFMVTISILEPRVSQRDDRLASKLIQGQRSREHTELWDRYQ